MRRRSPLARWTRAARVACACAAGLALAASARTAGAQEAGASRDAAIAQLERFAARHPASPARATVLLQIAELQVQDADARFAAAQRAGSAADHPDYRAPIARLEAILAAYPSFDRAAAARYTLGVLYASERRWSDAVRLLEQAAAGAQPYALDARFRLGDARFEMATQAAGAARTALFSEAARSYAAVADAPEGAGDPDLRILALYKAGWAHYNAADPSRPSSYEPALAAFGRLVDAFDTMTPERQARLGLRGEALEYMAVALARAGGASTVSRYFLRRGTSREKLAMLRRVAAALEAEGDDAGATRALEVLRTEAPTDSGALSAQEAILRLAEKRGASSEAAQAARLALINDFAAHAPWAAANPMLVPRAQTLRLAALQRSAQLALARAQAGERGEYARAAELYGRIVSEFFGTPAAREARVYHAEALLGQGRFAEAGSAYAWAASALLAEAGTSDAAGRTRAEQAGRNAVVAYDSALAHAPADRAVQDSMFAAAGWLAKSFPSAESARQALVQLGRRASETRRWDAMAGAFRTYAERYPTDDFAPTAAKLVGDALYRQGDYAAAQRQWLAAKEAARRRGRAALVDSIDLARRTATATYADSLVKRGEHWRAAEEGYVAFANAEPQSAAAADALRDGIETLRVLMATSGRSAAEVASARARAIELSARLVQSYPTYPQRAQVQALRVRLLLDAQRWDDAIAATREQVAQLGATPAAAEARVRLAVALDSAGQAARAAAAYEDFAAAHPADRRAPDALHNAAIAYAEAREPARAARAYGAFATRYPGDARAPQARLTRLAQLRAAGDSTTADAEFRSLCTRPSDGVVRDECRAASAKRAFERGELVFRRFQPERLVIDTRAELTAAGVQRHSARKQQLLREGVALFEEAIRSGVAEYVAGGTYYVGLMQYEYGDFLKNATLPITLSEAERNAAAAGAAAQAAEYYKVAERLWTALGEKASADPALARSERARPWLARARAALAGNVDRVGPYATPVRTGP